MTIDERRKCLKLLNPRIVAILFCSFVSQNQNQWIVNKEIYWRNQRIIYFSVVTKQNYSG